jgi:hypothetical protein
MKVGTSRGEIDDMVGELAKAEEVEAAYSHNERQNLVMGLDAG